MQLPPLNEVAAKRIRSFFLAVFAVCVLLLFFFLSKLLNSFDSSPATTSIRVAGPAIIQHVDTEKPLIDHSEKPLLASIAELPTTLNAKLKSTKMGKTLDTVKGLSTDNVVMMIASTGTSNGKYFRDRIIPSARTWMRFLKHVFVIIEDSVESRFSMRHCAKSEYGNFTTFACPDEPEYVLTRKCTSQYYVADGICCKFDETINFVANAHPKLFAKTKYLIQSDDDTYWRTDQLMRWLEAIELADINHLPLVMNIEPSYTAEKMAKKATLWHVDTGCYEVRTNGWYQPIAMNHLALEKIRVGTAAFGVTGACRDFDMSQDSGIGIFLWMYKLYHIYMPGIQINPNHAGQSIFKPDQMMVHAVRHTPADHCDGKDWPDPLRYDQDMIMGCGQIGRPGPFHDPSHGIDMYDAWDFFEKQGVDIVLGVAGSNDWIRLQPGEDIVFPQGLTAERIREAKHVRRQRRLQYVRELAVDRTGRRRLDGRLTSAAGGAGGGTINITSPLTLEWKSQTTSLDLVERETKADSRQQRRRLEDAPPKGANQNEAGSKDGDNGSKSGQGDNKPATASPQQASGANNATSKNMGRVIPYIVPIRGYDQTEHSKKYDVTKAYVPFKLTDCVIPGVINKHRFLMAPLAYASDWAVGVISKFIDYALAPE